MEVSPLVWGLTIAGIVGLLLFDFLFHVRKAHVPTLREAATWSALYVGIAVVFGLGVLIFGGTTPGSEYFAGYVTEKALSVDNLFVFLIIMTSFRVPREDQQKVLLFGIVFALVARTGFILLGAALINSFAWIFYLFGLILLLTAGNMLKPEGEESHSADNVIIRVARKVFTSLYGQSIGAGHVGAAQVWVPCEPGDFRQTGRLPFRSRQCSNPSPPTPPPFAASSPAMSPFRSDWASSARYCSSDSSPICSVPSAPSSTLTRC